jgi:hypothetical protein
MRVGSDHFGTSQYCVRDGKAVRLEEGRRIVHDPVTNPLIIRNLARGVDTELTLKLFEETGTINQDNRGAYPKMIDEILKRNEETLRRLEERA